MASPRIFISSTCYDLYDLRNNLRNFIKSFEYEPVMSEFGDIFYDYNLHVQDACLKEIGNCQMFILIIGNNYGSTYYKQKSSEKNPPSVTLTEFKKALSCDIAKHIFVNKMVKYDYDNYSKFLNQKYFEYFNNNTVEEKDVNEIKQNIRGKFDSEYFFPHESYKHIFKFFDVISELNMNNAILTFETTIDIQEQLKKQWAGFMYEGLINQNKKNLSTIDRDYSLVISKIDKIEKFIGTVLKDQNSEGKISIDINQISNNIDYSELEQYQDLFEANITEILYNLDSRFDDKRRGSFNEEINHDNCLIWLKSLSDILNKYKWSKTIDFKTVFSDFDTTQYGEDEHIPYKVLLSFNQLFQNLSEGEIDSFIDSIVEKLNKSVDDSTDQVAATSQDYDDLPW